MTCVQQHTMVMHGMGRPAHAAALAGLPTCLDTRDNPIRGIDIHIYNHMVKARFGGGHSQYHSVFVQ
jgi:hypothetical protein